MHKTSPGKLGSGIYRARVGAGAAILTSCHGAGQNGMATQYTTPPPKQKNSRVTVPLKHRAVLYEKLQHKAICVLNGVIIAISQYRYHAVSHT